VGSADTKAEEFNNKLLLAKDNEEQSAWDLAPNKCKSAVLEKSHVWANKAKIYLKIKLFFLKSVEEKTA
jgi:hypothetical protein